jgi:hypothetical protein
MSPSKCALIPRREVAGMVRYLRRDDVTSNCSFSCLSRARTLRQLKPPPRTIENRRTDVRSLGRGMGVLGLQGYLALSQGEATDGEGDGCVIIVTSFLVAGGQFSPLGSAEIMTWHYDIGKIYPTGVNFGQNRRGRGVSVCLRLAYQSFRVLW